MPQHDVLVIGAGLAGQRAALAAAGAGATVAIISKVHPVRSHSTAAAGGINAALNPEDTWESHAYDTVKGSDYLGDQDAIEIMCKEAPGEIIWLEHRGVTFHRDETGHLGTRAFGGAGQAFKPTTNALICTGDGIAQAYRVGTPLMDMEMVQYHPTTLVENGFLITEGARGEGAQLFNKDGNRFMERYAPNKLELASRDVVSRAEQTEINEGRGFPDGTVALDITKVPRKRTLEALREIVNIGKDFAGVDITREPIHIRPGCHYIMGGVKTDVWGETSIPGLYAAGEVACLSVHGGNRLGANSLLDTLIFGRRSGEHAAERALGMAMPTPSNASLADEQRTIDDIVRRQDNGGRRISPLKDALGTMMNEKCAVFRDHEGLTYAYETVARLKEEATVAAIDDRGSIFNQDVLGAIELGYMLDVAECIVVAALERRESRGAQFRLDFPKRNDDEWLKHITLSMNSGGPPTVSYAPVTLTKWEPEERRY